MLKLLLAFSFLFNVAIAQDAKGDKAEALRLWQKRDDQTSLRESLAKFEALHKADPADLDTITYLTRGYFLLADLHLEDKGEKKKTYEKAKDFGELGMSTNPEYDKKKKNDIEGAIATLTKREVPVTFWTAAALGKWSKLNGVMSSLKFKSQILGMVKQVEKLEPDFFHAAVPRYWGGFYAVAPAIAGGSMKKSKENFKEAIKKAPEYLGTRVLYAELYWTEEGDKKEFKKNLQEVIDAPIGPEELKPENTLEKKKAKKLLDNADEYF